jgi:uncharacterized protein (TIGR01777 family)
MKLLITGATGHIGKEIVSKAHELGHIVHFLTTRYSEINSLAPAKGFLWSPDQEEMDIKCFEGVEVVMHLAGASVSKRWTSAYKDKIRSSRIIPTQLLVQEAEKNKNLHQIRHVISASAIGIYPSDFNKMMKEDAKVTSNSFLASVVIDWEKEVDRFELLGVTLSKIRIGLVLTPKGGVMQTLKLPTLLGLGAAFGSGQQGQSWIHIDDLVEMFLFVAQEQCEGIFNAVAPNPVSQNEFMKALAKAYNRPYFMPPLPAFLLYLLVGEMGQLVLDSHWVSAQKIKDKGFNFKYPEIVSAYENLVSNS